MGRTSGVGSKRAAAASAGGSPAQKKQSKGTKAATPSEEKRTAEKTDNTQSPTGKTLSVAITDTVSTPGMHGAESQTLKTVQVKPDPELLLKFTLSDGTEYVSKSVRPIAPHGYYTTNDQTETPQPKKAEELSDLSEGEDGDDGMDSDEAPMILSPSVKQYGSKKTTYVVPLWHGQVSANGASVTLYAYTDNREFVNGYVIPSYGGYTHQNEVRWGRTGEYLNNILRLTMEDSVIMYNKVLNSAIAGKEKTGARGKKYCVLAQGFVVHHAAPFKKWDDVLELGGNIVSQMRTHIKSGYEKNQRPFDVHFMDLPAELYHTNLNHWIPAYDIYRVLQKANPDFSVYQTTWLTKNMDNLKYAEWLVEPGTATVEDKLFLGTPASWLKTDTDRKNNKKIIRYINEKQAEPGAAFKKVMGYETFDKRHAHLYDNLMETPSEYYDKKESQKSVYDAKGNKIA